MNITAKYRFVVLLSLIFSLLLAGCGKKYEFFDISYSDLPQELKYTDLSKKNVTVKITNLEQLKKFINEYIDIVGYDADLNFIDISDVTSLERLFAGSIEVLNIKANENYPHLHFFNGDISKWNTISVTNMNFTFMGSLFGGDISNWNVSNVEHLNSTFLLNGKVGNLDLSKWDVSKVKDFTFTFSPLTFFKHDLSNWNVKNAISLCGTFYNFRPKEEQDSNLLKIYDSWIQQNVKAKEIFTTNCEKL
ncbi:BspA family leucine-rich repeat surface protein [Psittacicella hinzii]|uniref:Lipoprotein n=1 Tax=Psittacicella hinzii TaxID=2028575 RepID=A0A3A1YME5_9GAMM|nr:BspA family leucine-rich repeat surface protein [Psittacicella hinzii]RIY37434.1 hypothetical protein CKF58_05090 [Psittacicella hinzii]